MIAFIDSGVGGLNVLAKCAKQFNQDFLFLCDNKFGPYGNKHKKCLLNITKNNINFLLENYKIDAVVLACNTLSFTVFNKLKDCYNIPIFRMEFNEKIINKLKKPVLFFATKNTIKNNKIIKNKINNKNRYKALYIRDLALLIDNNLNNLNKLKIILKKYLNSTKFKNINTIVLGCTHFVSIKKQIQSVVSKKLEFYDNITELVSVLNNSIPKTQNRSFKIVLTSPNFKKYVQLKKYLIHSLTNKD